MKIQLLRTGLRAIRWIERGLTNQIRATSACCFSSDWVSPRAAVWTNYLDAWHGKENVQMLEIGSLEGRSGIWFLEHVLTHPTSALTCVDLFQNRTAEIFFEHNINISGFSHKVTKIKGKSQEVLKVLREGHYDLIYIDGSHRAADVYADAVLSWPLLKANGLVIFDDYRWQLDRAAEERPQLAIDVFLNEMQTQLVLLHKDYQVIVQKWQ